MNALELPRSDGSEPATVRLPSLDSPLDHFLAHHAAQRALCAMLRMFAAAGSAGAADALAVVEYLARELPLHHRDEDADLFPAMRRRAKPEDALGGVLDRLASDHERIEALCAPMIAALSAPPARGRVRVDRDAAQAGVALAAALQEHIAIENGVVLAIAPQRLTRRDLADMTDAMKRRRASPAAAPMGARP